MQALRASLAVPANFERVSGLQDVNDAWNTPGDGATESALPRRIHFIWVGSEVPSAVLARMYAWAILNPQCDVRLWGESALAGLASVHCGPELGELLAAAPNEAAVSDVGRFAVLLKFGGIYLDTDMEARRPIASLLASRSGFIARESRWLLVASAVGLNPDALFARVALRVMTAAMRDGEVLSNFVTGPPLITELHRCMRILSIERPIVLPEWTFFPNNPFRFPRRTRSANPPYGVHLFDNSWGDGGELSLARRVSRAVLQPVLPRDVAIGNRRRVQLGLRRLSMIELASAVAGRV